MKSALDSSIDAGLESHRKLLPVGATRRNEPTFVTIVERAGTPAGTATNELVTTKSIQFVKIR